MFASLFFRIVNRSAKLPQENKISHEVRLLGCDLMWTRFVLPDYPVNSTRRTGKATAARAGPMTDFPRAYHLHSDPWMD